MTNFDLAIDKVLQHEGGLSDNPHDSGGLTKYGISQQTYPSLDIRSLTIEEAKEIYRRDWWIKYQYDLIESAKVSGKLFDLAVNMGQSGAVRCIQRALSIVWTYQIQVDGIMGIRTISAINSCARQYEGELYTALCHYAANYYEALNNSHFMRGWLRRAFA